MSVVSRINDFFRDKPLTQDQQLMLEQLQTNRAKAVYLIPEDSWREFLNSVYSDGRLKYLAIQTFASPESTGIYRSEYVSGHLNACLGIRGFGARLMANGVDLKRIVNVMLENISGS